MASNYDVLKAQFFVGGKPMPMDDQLDALAGAYGYVAAASNALERITTIDDNGQPLYDGEVSTAYTRDGKVGVKILCMYDQTKAFKPNYVAVNKRTLDAILKGDVVVRGGELHKVETIHFTNPTPHDPEVVKRVLELDFDAPLPMPSWCATYATDSDDNLVAYFEAHTRVEACALFHRHKAGATLKDMKQVVDVELKLNMAKLGLYRVTYEDHEGNTQHADVNATDESHAIQVLTALKMHVARAYMAQRIDEPAW